MFGTRKPRQYGLANAVETLPASVEWMTPRDMPQVLEIERTSFERSWEERHFDYALRHRNCAGMAAKHKDRVVGFMVYELYRDRIDLLRIAVHPKWRRYGVGRRLVGELVQKLVKRKKTRICIPVRERNLAAQNALRAMGFRGTGVLRGHYACDTGEDAFAMEYRLNSPSIA